MNFTFIKTGCYLVFMIVLLIMAIMSNDVFNSKLCLSVSIIVGAFASQSINANKE